MADQLLQIKNRLSGNVLFELKCASLRLCVEAAVSAGADLSGANLSGSDLSEANLSGANLSGSNLSGSNLFRANLSRADLSWANLSGADLTGATLTGADGKKTTIKKTPIQMSGLRWHIIIFDKDMRIGCEYHPLKDWWSYDDDRISEMDSHALDFWKQHKGILQGVCSATSREAGEVQP